MADDVALVGGAALVEEAAPAVEGGTAGRQQWVKDMKAKKHVEKTDGSYAGYITRFCSYLLATRPAALVERFRADFAALPDLKRPRKGATTRRMHVTKCVAEVDEARLDDTGMLQFAEITKDVVLEWMAEFKGKNGSAPHKSSFGSSQSALVDLWKRHGQTFPKSFYDGIKDVQKGAARTRAEQKVQGIVPMEEGKCAIPGHLYRELMLALLKSGEDIFAWVFSVFAWSLMCRVSNVAAIRAVHLTWDGDALVIHTVKHKADQEGERTDPKHCYANPFNPATCIITSLAVYFSVCGYPKDATELVFEGNRQHERFVDAIRRILEKTPALRAKLDALQITAEDIAAHSYRKGSRSYCQGGTTGGPSTPSILVRGGWAQSGMDKCYVRYEAAADQFIGRIVAMLDINSPSFATLFPHFDQVDATVLHAAESCFPHMPRAMLPVLVPCLASLVYHFDWFLRELPESHPLFKSVPFTQGIVRSLQGRVALQFDKDTVTPTGIPPHVSIQTQMRLVHNAVDALPGKMREAIAAEFEKRALDQGSITRSALEEMFAGAMTELKAALLPQAAPPPQPVVVENTGAPQTWLVDGRVRRAPRDFAFNTKLSAQNLFQLYCRGDQEARVGPYRRFESCDFVDQKQRKRLSDMQALMGPIARALKQRKVWRDDPTVDQVNEMWDVGSEIIAVARTTDAGRPRRMRQMSWTSQLKLYRKRQRVADAEEVESDADEYSKQSE